MSVTSAPGARSSKVMAMKSSDQEGSMTTSSIYVGTHSTNFHPPEMVEDLEGAQAQLPVKSESDESAEMRDEFQENGGTLPSEDLYRNGIPAYSLLLYKPGSNSSMESSPADMNPLIITTTGGGSHGVPCVAEIFTSLPQPQVLVTSSQVSGRTNQDTFSSASNIQTVDPAWLHVLSNILKDSSEGKRMRAQTVSIPVLSECQSTRSKPYSGLSSVTEASSSRVSSPVNAGTTAKLPLSDITNKLTRQQCQGNSMAVHVPRGEYVMMSPAASNLEDCSRNVSATIHVVPAQTGYFPTFIDKPHLQPHSDPIQHVNLTSSGEDSQMTSPLKTNAVKEQPNNHSLGSSSMSKLNMPIVTNSPLSNHEGFGGPMRESHNMKERRRRARIKDACNLMRQLVPGMSHKTDKATVFEFSARYIHFLKSFVGSSNDKDFLLKYNPY